MTLLRLLILFVMGVGSAAWADDATRVIRDGEQILREETDRNKDGIPDDILTYRNGVRIFRSTDKDFDGQDDVWYFYNKKGILKRRARDSNKDGKPDQWTYFERGRQVVLKEYDRNYDGKVDRRSLMEWGLHRQLKIQRYLPVEVEEDRDFDGIIDSHRIRGQKTPNPDKTGQPMHPDHKRIIETQEPKKTKKAYLWDVEKAVEERTQFENEVQKSQENGAKYEQTN